MDALRWVLLIIGAIIFLLIFFLSKKKSSESRSRSSEKIEPGFLQQQEQNDSVDNQTLSPFDEPADDMHLYATEADADTEELANEPRMDLDNDEKLIVLYLVERHAGLLSGNDIIDALEQAGMSYGDMKIFHYFPDNIKNSKQPVFSIANLVDPGSFDMRNITDLETPGLSLFLKLPGPVGSIRAFDLMVKVIEKLQSCLPLIVKDRSRNIVSKQMLMHLREEVVEYDRMSTIA